jgi:hypothetical protein
MYDCEMCECAVVCKWLGRKFSSRPSLDEEIFSCEYVSARVPVSV